MVTSNFSQQAKKTALYAMAQQSPDFKQFYYQYKRYADMDVFLPYDFVDDVFAILDSDPMVTLTIRKYAENAQATKSFGASSLAYTGFMIAVLFLLSTHIKFYRTLDGKWEFLLEHPALQGEILKKVAETLINILNKPI